MAEECHSPGGCLFILPALCVEACTRGFEMKYANYADFHARLDAYCDEVERDGTELVIIRQGHEDLVLLPLSEYASWSETLHLLAYPANAEHLRASIEEAERGDVVSINSDTPEQ